MKILVIGSGLLGVSSAHALATAGHEVTVLDRAASAAQGTSHANAGMITPSMADPWNAPGIHWDLLRWLGREEAPFLLRPAALPGLVDWGLRFLAASRPAAFRRNLRANLQLARYSQQVMAELRARLDLPHDHRANGTIKVFSDPRHFEAAAGRNRVLSELGLALRTVDAGEAVAIEPALAPVRERIVGAVYCPADESGDARAWTEQLARHTAALGARFRYGTEVTALVREGDRLVAARAGSERFEADEFVLAAGAWSEPLLRGLGLQLPVRPVKGYSITVPMGDWRGAPRMPVIDDAMHLAATPLGRRLRVAGTAELAGDDRALTQARIENLFAAAARLFPSLAPWLDRGACEPWAGLRPMSADGVPRIGRLACGNLWLNTGQGHLGWTLAAGSARLLADMLANRAPAVDPAPYDPSR